MLDASMKNDRLQVDVEGVDGDFMVVRWSILAALVAAAWMSLGVHEVGRGTTSDSGVLCGAGISALAGAVLSVEVLKASWVYWFRALSATRNSSTIQWGSFFVEDL
ncbi:hypothetical protein Tco_0126760 [Tanacetum coccineum]